MNIDSFEVKFDVNNNNAAEDFLKLFGKTEFFYLDEENIYIIKIS
mgnify:CR=1 FL=1